MKYKEFDRAPPVNPVKEGDVIKVKIVDRGKQGDGMARVQGLVIFVKDGKVGEEIEVKIVRTTRNAAFAEKVSA
ncbi:MAG: translation initiation factor IF-2 subunit beta [Methanomassiliicoccales archaeon PtaU1.Bin124]|nr:MAG: translation initiation factor IF-2 subunit beta [Methanomassiliicoccales archaeon PtaU1.Bin124]